MSNSNRRPNVLRAPNSNPATDLLKATWDAEAKRRSLHRELSTQSYTIQPMNGPDVVGDFEVIDFDTLLVLVGQFNKGCLPHCDDWFTIEGSEKGEKFQMNTFYQFVK